jgi:hypothetical protein
MVEQAQEAAVPKTRKPMSEETKEKLRQAQLRRQQALKQPVKKRVRKAPKGRSKRSGRAPKLPSLFALRARLTRRVQEVDKVISQVRALAKATE